MSDDVADIDSYISTISDNAGSTASFAEDIATNTLNTYNKVTTISEDTTQMRADLANIYNVLDTTATEEQTMIKEIWNDRVG